MFDSARSTRPESSHTAEVEWIQGAMRNTTDEDESEDDGGVNELVIEAEGSGPSLARVEPKC